MGEENERTKRHSLRVLGSKNYTQMIQRLNVFSYGGQVEESW